MNNVLSTEYYGSTRYYYCLSSPVRVGQGRCCRAVLRGGHRLSRPHRRRGSRCPCCPRRGSHCSEGGGARWRGQEERKWGDIGCGYVPTGVVADVANRIRT